MTTVSSFHEMHKDVYNSAEDIRALLVLVPFHKEMRYDGKMVCRKEGRRCLNLDVLQSVPCTIGILVDRWIASRLDVDMSFGYSGRIVPTAEDSPSFAGHSEFVHRVAAIFFGGPDDREAVAYAGRLAMHPSAEVTVVRFLPASTDAAGSVGTDDTADVARLIDGFMSNFRFRFVERGEVKYVEKFVANGAETMTALKSMAGSYTLFLVGRGELKMRRMTKGIRDREECECPELGPLGDALASQDFRDTGSVLILQQHNVLRRLDFLESNKDEIIQ